MEENCKPSAFDPVTLETKLKLETETLKKSQDSAEEVFQKRKSRKKPPALSSTELTGPRWKGKNFSSFALNNPMSSIVKQLQDSFIRDGVAGELSGCDVLLPARSEQADLLDRACFGRRISTLDGEITWFQLGPEEAFYLVHALGCLKISSSRGQIMEDEQIWKRMSSCREMFPDLYTAYDRLRAKNWVVRPGIQYGVDFVAYRHHPALVHSEYAVLVLRDAALRPRLREWADLQGTLRVCGSVAKALMVITVRGWQPDAAFPLCLERRFVEERVMARWIPQQNRDGRCSGEGNDGDENSGS